MKKFLSVIIAVIITVTCLAITIPEVFAADNYTVVNVTPANNGDAADVIQEKLNLARDNATASNPYKIVVAKGNYTLSKHLILYSNTYLECTGASFKKNYNSGTMLTIGLNSQGATGNSFYKNITINGGTFDADGQSGKKTGSILNFSHASDVKITNATFKNCCDGHHIGFAGCKNVTVSGCSFSGHYYSSNQNDNNMEAIQLDILEPYHFPDLLAKSYDYTMNEDITVTNCNFSNVNRGLGSHSSFTGRYMKNIKFTNNTFNNIGGYAIQTSNYLNITISGNTINNCGAGIYYRSINPEYANLYAKDSTPVKDTSSVIKNNTVTITDTKDKTFNQLPYGIRVYGENVTKDTKIENGTLKKGDYRAYGVTISDNKITVKTCANAIWLYGAVGTKISKNTISYVAASSKDTCHGIRIDTSSSVNISENKINANSVSYVKNGIITDSSTSVTINSNQVSKAALNGINISAKSTANLSKNTVSSNGECGIFCYNGSKISTSSNTVKSNKKHGVFFVNCSSQSTMSNDTITSNSNCGVAIQNSKATLTSVKSNSNKKYGIYLTQGSSATISKCTASSNSSDGIFLTQKSTATISGSTVSSNGECGIHCYNNSKISTSSNTVKSNKKHGIFFVNCSSQSTMSKDTISSNTNYGVAIQNSKAKLTSVKSSSNKKYGIYLTQSSTAAISKCTASSNSSDGILVAQKSNATISSSTVSSNGECGIHCYKNSKISTSSNTVKSNKKHGVFFVDCSTQSTMSKDTITSNLNYGVAIQNSKAKLTSVKSNSNKKYGIYLTQSASATISKCTVSSNSSDGIYSIQKSNAAISNSTISSNKGNGIYFTNSAKGSVKSTKISNNGKYGIYRTNKAGKVSIEKVTYSKNKSGKIK